MKLSLERSTKYFALALVGLALFAALGTQVYAATASAQTNLQVIVGAAANISVVTGSPTAISLIGATDFTGHYTGSTQIQFGLRTNASTTSSITVKGITDFHSTPAGHTGPSLDNKDLSYSCTALDAAGSPGVLNGSPVFCAGGSPKTIVGTPTDVLTGIGGLSKTNNALLTLTWTIPSDSPSWDADTYSGTIEFMVTAN